MSEEENYYVMYMEGRHFYTSTGECVKRGRFESLIIGDRELNEYYAGYSYFEDGELVHRGHNITLKKVIRYIRNGTWKLTD